MLDWTLQGSNDGLTWEIIDTRSISSFPKGTMQRFDIYDNKKYFYFHKFDITRAEDTDTCIGLITTYGIFKKG